MEDNFDCPYYRCRLALVGHKHVANRTNLRLAAGTSLRHLRQAAYLSHAFAAFVLLGRDRAHRGLASPSRRGKP